MKTRLGSIIALVFICAAGALGPVLSAQSASENATAANPAAVSATHKAALTIQQVTVPALCSDRTPRSMLQFESSDARLVQGFDWAKQQAMDYVHGGCDPVGAWYETGLPGRTRFSMRDTSHQAMGAQALGLANYNLNMLRHFAENISDSKDWCSFWGIDRWGRPASVDYKSDARFWYDLPANFDVLDASYRMFLWTGDAAYINSPVFLNFYARTVSDYVERWDLGPEHVMKRKRWLNVRGELDPNDDFQTARGIPGYQESHRDYVVGVDLLGTEYGAFKDYAYIEAYRAYFDNTDRAQTEVQSAVNLSHSYLKKAAELKDLINNAWWNEKTSHFYQILDSEYQLQPSASPRDHVNVELLYRGAIADGPKLQSAVHDFVEHIQTNPQGCKVEGESHFPEVLYRYGAADAAYAEIMDLTQPGKCRQEYPEVSYSLVGAFVTGLMGINVEAPWPEDISTSHGYTEIIIETLPRLTNRTSWAEMDNLPIRTSVVSIRHSGDTETTFTNQSGPSLIWQATFPGSYDSLLVNGKQETAHAGKEPPGQPTSWVRLIVGPGDKVTVKTPK